MASKKQKIIIERLSRGKQKEKGNNWVSKYELYESTGMYRRELNHVLEQMERQDQIEIDNMNQVRLKES